MKIGLKKILVFLLILSILTISTASASDIKIADGINADNSDSGNTDKIMEINEDSKIEANDNSKLEISEDTKLETNDNSELVSESSKLVSESSNAESNNGLEKLETTPELDNMKSAVSSLENNNPNDQLRNSNDNQTNLSSSNTEISSSGEVKKSVIVKTTPRISIKTSRLKSRDVLIIFLKNSTKEGLKYKKLKVEINNKNYTVKTNSEGMGQLNLLLLPKRYNLKIFFNGDKYYNPVTKKFKLKVSKLSTKIRTYANYVVRKKRLDIYLLGKDWKGIPKAKVIIKFRKRTYVKTTNRNGRVSLKISAPFSKYKISAKFKGNKYFYKSSKTFKFYVIRSTQFKIENRKLLTKGYLRITLKDRTRKAISNKKMIIKIGKKRFIKRTNSQGRIIFRPKVKENKYTVVVKYGKYSVNKRINCINGSVKDPLKHKIPLVNGAPNLDYMPGNYVMGDDSATYTLKRSQYMEVIRRDSYCLYLNNKLSRYVFFSTKSHPNTKYILKREKWNVIEREINKRIVKKNKYNYWPGTIKVSLKGKSYKYPEVRDVQNTGYTCGPASASVCSQVLRNYVCEKYLARLSGTNREGTKIPKLEKALRRNNFTCEYFYRNSFKVGLSELKKGGCALIFHAQDHYVSILDISRDGKKVLVSNSYKNYDGIPTGWVSVGKMNKKFGHFHDSLVVRLNYTLSNSKKESVNCFYYSMGRNWYRHSSKSSIGRT